MARSELYWSLVERVWDTISIYDGPQTFLQQFSEAAEVPRILFAAHWCRSEVCNGGLHQFFWNSTGILAPEAVEAYRAIQMPNVASVILEAIQWFGPGYPRDVHDRRCCLNSGLKVYDSHHLNSFVTSSNNSPFHSLDDRFYALIDSENAGFEAAADSYAKQHIT